MEGTVEILNEFSVWRSREVKYISGKWNVIKGYIPDFELQDFGTPSVQAINPFYKQVMRLPLQITEVEIPIGLVSKSYTLACSI